jgi:hypothetical protein
MADTPTPTKPILEVSIITGLTFLVDTFVVDPAYKTKALTAIPAVGGSAAYFLRRLGKHLRYRELRTMEEGYLHEAQHKRAQPGLLAADIKRLDKEIANRQQTLEQLRRDNLLF